jgi:hypothetical protein
LNPGGYSAEGDGWRVAWDPARLQFPVLIGGGDWAVELTHAEAIQLREGIAALIDQLEAIAGQLMPQESIALELDRGTCWLGLDGDREGWRLRFVLSPGQGHRAVEGGWATGAGAPLALALSRLPLQAQTQ